MELIKKLGTRKNKTGVLQSWGEFYCSFCKSYVEKLLGNGKATKSCGCAIKQLQSESKKGYRNPQYGLNGILNTKFGKIRSYTTKELISKAMKGKKRKPFTEETKQKMKENHANFSLENHPNWNNGSSFEPYSSEFNKQLKQSILERDNYQCQNPNCNGIYDELHIHHIDYDKQNNIQENLITLCHSCHMKTNSKNNRQYCTEFYQNIMINRIVECLL